MILTHLVFFRFFRGAGEATEQPAAPVVESVRTSFPIKDLDKKHLKYLRYHDKRNKPRDKDHWPYKR